jgi:hypothetical protein
MPQDARETHVSLCDFEVRGANAGKSHSDEGFARTKLGLGAIVIEARLAFKD